MEDFDKDLAQLVVHSNEKFHKKFFDMVKDPSKNQIMSAYSVSSGLGMLLHGTLVSYGLEEDKAFDDFAKNYKVVAQANIICEIDLFDFTSFFFLDDMVWIWTF